MVFYKSNDCDGIGCNYGNMFNVVYCSLGDIFM